MNIYIVDEMYQNPGILKNFDYNTIITGSSMTENFRVSWFEDENPETKVVKVPYPAGYSKNYDIVFDLAFDTHEIKTVYYGMDPFHIFIKSSDETINPLPEYLYDDILLNDVEYIFNKDVLYKYTLYNIILGKQYNNDLAYNWSSNHKYGLDQVLQTYIRPKKSDEQQAENYLMIRYEENIRNITKYIEQYPNTKFKIFFPPYSILEWDTLIRRGELNSAVAVTKRVMEDLLKYENVELYYFQNVEEIVTNFDNYKDYTHHNEEINYYIFESICKTGRHRITKENYRKEIEEMYNLALNYDYSKIFGEERNIERRETRE